MHQDPLVLDPTARGRAHEERLLHKEEGPVLVDILGELAWAVADPDLLASLLTDPRVSKDPASTGRGSSRARSSGSGPCTSAAAAWAGHRSRW